MSSSSPIRILYLDHTAKLSGGEMALVRLLGALDRTRVEPIVVLAEEGPLVELLQRAQVETHVLPLDPMVREVRKDSLGDQGIARKLQQATLLLGYSQQIARVAREKQVSLIYTNSLKSDFYGALAGQRVRLPVIWHIRDRIEETYLPAPAVKAIRLLARRIPACVVANSESTLETLKLEGKRPSEVIVSGMTQEYIARCRAPRKINAIPTIGIIGRISAWKGQDIFLKAAAQVLATGIDARFQIIGAPMFGEDAFEGTLKALAQELRIADKVVFRGFQSDIPAVLRSLDILVHASTTPEPFGQVIVEGMVAGLPVIATNGGGAREIITHEKTGLLVPMGDIDALVQGLIRLLTRPDEARTLAEAGQRHALATYTVEISARKSEALYERLVGRSPTVA